MPNPIVCCNWLNHLMQAAVRFTEKQCDQLEHSIASAQDHVYSKYAADQVTTFQQSTIDACAVSFSLFDNHRRSANARLTGVERLLYASNDS